MRASPLHETHDGEIESLNESIRIPLSLTRSSRDVAIVAGCCRRRFERRFGRRHNVSGFILILHVNLREGAAEPSMQALLLAVVAAVRKLP